MSLVDGRQQATILDVARHAGVSRTTVSRVLNEPEKVAASTVERVRASVEALKFVANPTAQALRHGRVSIITLITNDLSLPFTGEFATMFSRLAAEAGYTVSLVSHSGDEQALVESLRKQSPSITSAVVLALTGYVESPAVKGEIERLLADGLSVVVSGDELPDVPVPTFAISYPDAVADAARRLIESGRKSILLLDAPGVAQAKGFARAYREVIEANGLEPLVLNEDIKNLDYDELVDVLSRHAVDGVIARSVRLAIAAGTTASDLGLRRDVPVICCSSSELLEYIRPAIDSYEVDIEQYSRSLLTAVLDPKSAPARHTTLVPKFFHRSGMLDNEE